MQELTTFLYNHLLLSTSIAVAFALLIIVEWMRSRQATQLVTILEATQLINHQQAVVIDIRHQEAYRKGHIIDAQLISPKEIAEKTKKLEKLKQKPIILVCQTSIESQKVAALLNKQGYNAHALADGMRGWIEAQMPLVKES